jgi:hypothetical protein
VKPDAASFLGSGAKKSPPAPPESGESVGGSFDEDASRAFKAAKADDEAGFKLAFRAAIEAVLDEREEG